MQIGSVVMATAGKEKGQIFVIVKSEDKYVYLSDGKRLRVEKPKKKSVKHVEMFCDDALSIEVISDKNARVNSAVRKHLSKIRSEHV